MTLVEMQVKWSVTLTDRLGPEILTVLEIKGQVLHRVRLHVKVPGWLLSFNALLTKKLPKFLSRLNEVSLAVINGSYRKIFRTRPKWSRDGESLDVIHAIITLKKETKRKIAIELLSAAVSAALLRLIP